MNRVGTDSGNGASLEPVFSPDGTKVLFTTWSSDLGTNGAYDTNAVEDVYVRDLISGETLLVSVNGAGTDAGDGGSFEGVFSPDGTKVAFMSRADDLGPTDSPRFPTTEDQTDVYLRDLTRHTTTLVSVNASGTDSGNEASYTPRFSPDGTKIVFDSRGTNLGPTDTNNLPDDYVRDLASATTSLVATNAAGTGSANLGVADTAFSPDGTKVAFVSAATDLGPAASGDGIANIYLRDLVTGTVDLLSTGADGGGDGSSFDPAFSPDGTKVAFSSTAANLGPPDTHGHYDLYVRDLTTHTTILVSVNAAGTDAGNGGSQNLAPSWSPDSTRIAFESLADDLVPTDTNMCILTPPLESEDPCPDVFVRDLTSGTTTLVSVNSDGDDSGDGRSELPSFNPDGTKVLFQSNADDLGPTDTDRGPGDHQETDVYVRDLTTGTTTLVSATANGHASGNGRSSGPVFSPDGTRIAFDSDATDLGPTDTNLLPDVYSATLTGASAGGLGASGPG